MYDKDEINSIAILYSVDPGFHNFELLLRVLSPMVDYVLMRHPEVKEHWEDLRQEVLIKIWDNLSSVPFLRKVFTQNIPADYFFFRIRDYLKDSAIPKIKGTYDMYNPAVKAIEDLSAKEKARIAIDPNGEDFDEWA